jgi:NAD(P)-dependent dehydrogenase (short-subunit alcohol dehydrogenase family)
MKNAVVTGGSRGIGAAICEVLAGNGYQVFATYRSSRDEARALEARLEGVHFSQLDCSHRESISAFIERVRSKRIDALVNNAGTIQFQDLRGFDLSSWDRVMQTNLNAPLQISVGLKDSIIDHGAIVNIASTDGLVGAYNSLSYAASKAALMNLTKSLALNFGQRRIRVNAIAPGWIETAMNTLSDEEAARLTPLGRNGTPMDVANVVGFLISDKAGFISGETVVVDGGYDCVDFILRKDAELMGWTDSA